MKKKILLIFCSLFLITACNKLGTISDKKDGAKEKSFTSYDQKFEIVANDSWSVTEEKGELNQSAEIEIYNNSSQKYLIALMESKEDISWTYDYYSEYILNQNATIYESTFDDVKTTTVGGYNTKYVEFKTDHNGINIYMRIYVVETKNYYGQILMWTKYSMKDEIVSEFDSMISSFKEIVE